MAEEAMLRRREAQTRAAAEVRGAGIAPPYDARWLTLIVGAVVLGLVMAFSASYPGASALNAEGLPGDAFKYLKLHLIFAAVGMVAMLITARLRPATIERCSGWGLAGFLAAMLVVIIIGLASGEKTRGAMLFLDLGPVRFQPSEFAKVFFIVFLSAKLATGGLGPATAKRVGYPVLWATGIFCLLLLAQGDQGMMVVVFLLALGMCYLGGMSLRSVGASLLVAGLSALAIAFSSPERAERIYAWIDPRKYDDRSGRHVLAMLVASARGWLGGLGLGMSPDKWGQMPEAHTDSIFCVMAGELGLLVMAAFLVMFGALVTRAFQVGRASRDHFGYYLCSGIGLMFGLQALINMMVATNLMPVTGLTLPFISYGGSSLISCLMAAGMVMAVYRDSK